MSKLNRQRPFSNERGASSLQRSVSLTTCLKRGSLQSQGSGMEDAHPLRKRCANKTIRMLSACSRDIACCARHLTLSKASWRTALKKTQRCLPQRKTSLNEFPRILSSCPLTTRDGLSQPICLRLKTPEELKSHSRL